MQVKAMLASVGQWFDMASHITSWKKAIKDLPTTNWLTFTGTGVGIGTAIVFGLNHVVKWILSFKFGHIQGWKPPQMIELDIWIAWLAFVASWMGFSVRQFKHKRETQFNETTGDSIRHAQARNGGAK
ncbi:MAG: hypothetical protein AMS18_00110 [Gemmatimonas sp. SG8_17]|nr:MAG: hypothetical protein AMS18_00110 [Gemmatimonas sp. SG8_17]